MQVPIIYKCTVVDKIGNPLHRKGVKYQRVAIYSLWKNQESRDELANFPLLDHSGILIEEDDEDEKPAEPEEDDIDGNN